MLLAVTALALSLVFGAASPTPTLALTPTGTPTPPPTTVPSATPTPPPTTTLGVTPTASTTPTLTPWPTAAATFTPTATVVPTATAVPMPKPPSQLPATLPGLSHDEGTFLVTAGDNGGRADYFIAGNQRHSILVADEQLELQINPLWPVRGATRDEVLTYPEGAPVGSAHTGLLTAPTVVAKEPVADAPVADVPAPAATVASAPDALTADVPAPAAPAAAIADVPTPADATATYTLRRGDNLTELAATYATSIEAILAANGITNPNRIYVGQTLTIPSGAPTSTLAEPAPVADAPAATEPVADVPPTSDASYTVQRGDSAIGIARRFGIDEAALLEANQIANPNRVYVGQVLTIPAAND